MVSVELAWLAGLLEGEGCFKIFQDTRPKLDGTRSWRYAVYIKMTDLDVLERARDIGGVGTICTANSPSKPEHYKPSWQWQVQRNTDALWLMRTILPYMGTRRSAKIHEILEHSEKGGE